MSTTGAKPRQFAGCKVIRRTVWLAKSVMKSWLPETATPRGARKRGTVPEPSVVPEAPAFPARVATMAVAIFTCLIVLLLVSQT